MHMRAGSRIVIIVNLHKGEIEEVRKAILDAARNVICDISRMAIADRRKQQRLKFLDLSPD